MFVAFVYVDVAMFYLNLVVLVVVVVFVVAVVVVFAILMGKFVVFKCLDMA